VGALCLLGKEGYRLQLRKLSDLVIRNSPIGQSRICGYVHSCCHLETDKRNHSPKYTHLFL